MNRDREEREMRVRINNQKKEEEAAQRKEIIRKRERAVEMLKEQQTTPLKSCLHKSPAR